MAHTSVLLEEVIRGLEFKEGDVFLDATVNGGGISRAVCDRCGKKVKIIGIDADGNALSGALLALGGGDCDVALIQANFRELPLVLDRLHVSEITKSVFDLGLSGNQLLSSGRGFSFSKDEPLLMTLKENPGPGDLTASYIVNHFDEKGLSDILKGYGEERYATRIAREIVERRKIRAIERTGELVECVRAATPSSYHHGRIHFATKTFQALRIAVNDELRTLTVGLEKAFERLRSGGRIAVISFHSLEDRIVKNFFRDKTHGGFSSLITKKPITPTREEIETNPRSRSAKLRIIEKL